METVQAAPAPVNPVRQKYERVNGTWPTPPSQLPKLTGQEAISAAKRLYRLGTGKAFVGKWEVTSGNRHSYPRWGRFWVNPEKGWHALVHNLSHVCHRKVNPTHKPHSPSHAWLERKLIEHVVTEGWLDGKLRLPEKPKADTGDVRYERVLSRIASWERKAKRAANALKKLSRTKAYYDRQRMN
jgi:hypothetical protein